MKKVIRVSRHPADDSRLATLRAAFGDDVNVVTDDFRFGDNPVAALADAVARAGGEVVAVEAQAPLPVLAAWLQARGREVPRELLFLRVVFARGEDGRVKVVAQDDSGRDILAFESYEVVERVEVKTRPL